MASHEQLGITEDKLPTCNCNAYPAAGLKGNKKQKKQKEVYICWLMLGQVLDQCMKGNVPQYFICIISYGQQLRAIVTVR